MSSALHRSFLLLLASIALMIAEADGHGSLDYPKSRVLRVYETMELPSPPPWTAQALALDGTNAYYTWAQLSRNIVGAINGDSQPYYDHIPDGQIASGGNNPRTASLPGYAGLSFSGLNSVSNQWEWPTTAVSAGPMEMVFKTTAHHDPSFFKVWITRSAYNHRTPLKWSDLEYLGSPAHSFSGVNYRFTVNLPEREGHHVIYCAYQRVDPAGEVFLAAADVRFGEGETTETPALSLGAPVTVQENADTAVVTATLSSAAPAGGVTAQYSTVAGTAGSADFASTSGTLTFASGQTQKAITVPILDDSVQESDEVFTLALSGITGAVGGQTTCAVTIRDNDTPPGAGTGYAFTIYNNWGSGWQGKLDLSNGGPAAWTNWTLEFDAPWTISTGSISGGVIQSHTGNHYVIKPTSWNGTIAAGETLTFDWVVNGSTNTTPPANVTINGQALTASAPALALEPVTRPEGDGPAIVDLTVTLERAHAEAIHVAYATLDGTARAGTDYTASSGTLVFAPGDLTKSISVPYAGNTVNEPVKTFTVALAGVNGQAPPRFITGKQSALVSLTDDDNPPTLLVTGDSLLEENSGTHDATFRLRLSRAPKPAETISVRYVTAPGTATSGIDYTPRSGTLVFTSADATITVPVIGDTHDERLELFHLTLDTPVGCTPVNTSATAQIIDEDTPANAYGNQRIVAYLDMTAGSVNLPPANRVTHLMAAFANVNADGSLPAESVSPWNSLKATNPALRILLSVGGWNWSPPFTAVANDPAKRAAFAQSCAQYVQTNGIDGIDLDWEWPGGGNTVPNANDRANFTALVHSVRLALDTLSITTGKAYELTCYAPATAGLLASWDLTALKEDFDFFNVQGYDLHGTWDSRTGHQSALHRNVAGPDDKLNITEVLALYTAAGVPRSQLLIGAPFYGQVWNNAGPEANGLFQPATGSHTPTYATIATGSARTHLRVWDNSSKVPFLYDIMGGRQWTAYDDPQSILEKADYSAMEGFAGVYFWQLGGDSSDRQLLVTLSDSLARELDPDSDDDGLPDRWEIQYYGNLTAADATSDTDGDGKNSYAEMVTRTNPTDPASLLRCGLHPGEDHMVVGFDSQLGVTYRIQRAFLLTDWVTLTTVAGNGLHYHYTDDTLPLDTLNVFYRIVVDP